MLGRCYYEIFFYSQGSDGKVQVKFDLAFKTGTSDTAAIINKLKSSNGSGGFQIDASSLSVTKTIGKLFIIVFSTKIFVVSNQPS